MLSLDCDSLAARRVVASWSTSCSVYCIFQILIILIICYVLQEYTCLLLSQYSLGCATSRGSRRMITCTMGISISPS